MPLRRLSCVLGALVLFAAPAAAEDAFAGARRRMVANIEQLAAASAREGVPRLDGRVLEVMRRTPREQFVPEGARNLAYTDNALAIGHEATISQPFVVALMTSLLQPEPDH